MLKQLTQCIFFLSVVFTSGLAWANSSQILHVQFSSEPSQYDPLMMEDGTALRLAANIFGTLTEYDHEGSLKLALLESFKTNKEATEYILTFKPNLKWSDGVDFKAEHFLNALERLSNAKIKVALSALFPSINFSMTTVLSPTQIKVVLDKPDSLFLQWCSLPPFAPIREEMIKAYEKKPSSLVPTLAAFRMSEIKRDELIRLEKNSNYYNAQQNLIDEVQILLLKDEQSFLPLLKIGKIDLLTRVPILQIEQIKKVVSVATIPVAATTYLGLNVRRPPFDQLENRQLLKAEVNEKLIALAKTLKTDELPAHQFIPLALQQGIHLPKINKPKPRTIIAKYTLQSDSGSRNQTIMEFIQHMIKEKQLGTAQLEILDWREHLARLKVGSTSISGFRLGWQNPVADPYVFYQVFASDSPNNFTGWKSEKYDEQLKKLRAAPDDLKNKELRLKIVNDLEEILAEEAPAVPLLHQVLKFAYSKRVRGFRANPFGVILFREIRLDKK